MDRVIVEQDFAEIERQVFRSLLFVYQPARDRVDLHMARAARENAALGLLPTQARELAKLLNLADYHGSVHTGRYTAVFLDNLGCA